jgi:hypothetical protein
MDRSRLILWIALLAVTASAAFLPEAEPPVDETVEAVVRPAGPPVPGTEKPVTGESGKPPGKEIAAADIFAAKSWAAPPPASPAPATAPPPPPAPPGPPPLPFQFLGRFDDGTTLQAFLQREDKAYVVTAGQIVDGVYRVESIDSAKIALTYLPQGITQNLSVGSLP